MAEPLTIGYIIDSTDSEAEQRGEVTHDEKMFREFVETTIDRQHSYRLIKYIIDRIGNKIVEVTYTRNGLVPSLPKKLAPVILLVPKVPSTGRITEIFFKGFANNVMPVLDQVSVSTSSSFTPVLVGTCLPYGVLGDNNHASVKAKVSDDWQEKKYVLFSVRRNRAKEAGKQNEIFHDKHTKDAISALRQILADKYTISFRDDTPSSIITAIVIIVAISLIVYITLPLIYKPSSASHPTTRRPMMIVGGGVWTAFICILLVTSIRVKETWLKRTVVGTVILKTIYDILLIALVLARRI